MAGYQLFRRRTTCSAGKEPLVAATTPCLKELNTSYPSPSPPTTLSSLPRLNLRRLASIQTSMSMGTYAWTYYKFVLITHINFAISIFLLALATNLLSDFDRISGHLLMMWGRSCSQFRACLEVKCLKFVSLLLFRFIAIV